MAERRRNALTGDWVIVSPGRAQSTLAGQSRRSRPRSDESLGQRLLSVSAQYACPWSGEPGLSRHLRIRQRFPCARRSLRRLHRPPSRCCMRKPMTGQVPRAVLFGASRRDACVAVGRGTRRRGRPVAQRSRRTRPAVSVGSGVREQRRADGLLESASARPGVGDIGCADDCRSGRTMHQRDYATHPHSVLLLDYARRETRARGPAWLRATNVGSPSCRIGRRGRSKRCCCRCSTGANFDELDARDIADLAAILAQLLPAYDRLFDVVVSVFDGLARARPRPGRALATARALLSAAAAFGQRAQVHGGVRNARGSAARPVPGRGGRAAARTR